ncbi:MAG TPA: J domain-containing protein, partial [Candidatus Limnocylindrales bacterium]|nr:J domain-containing protein [Candidatus Limnocylindrales bacterium]
MPPRPMLPPDDLYARLELPVDASAEAIEFAWRALLKRHHPDVAGAHTDDIAKRINVAHDWLSDPELRARYDRERHPRRGRLGAPAAAPPKRHAGKARSAARPVRRRAVDPA